MEIAPSSSRGGTRMAPPHAASATPGIIRRRQSAGDKHTDGVGTIASFRLFGEAGLTAAAVTRRLGLQPTAALEAGSAISRRSTRTRDSCLWLLRSNPAVESGVELSTQLQRLLTILEPHTGQLWDLVSAGYEANWFCYVASHACEHAVELDRQLLQRLLALPGELWLDVCGDDTDDE